MNAQRDAFLRVAHAELVDERAGRVGELPLRQLRQVLVLPAPGELHELVVRRAAEHDGVAVGEVLGQLGEADDLGRADEGEVLGIEVDHLPLAGEGLLVDRFERRDALFLGLVESGLDAHDVEGLQGFADGLHCDAPWVAGASWAPVGGYCCPTKIMGNEGTIQIGYCYVDGNLKLSTCECG